MQIFSDFIILTIILVLILKLKTNKQALQWLVPNLTAKKRGKKSDRA